MAVFNNPQTFKHSAVNTGEVNLKLREDPELKTRNCRRYSLLSGNCSYLLKQVLTLLTFQYVVTYRGLENSCSEKTKQNSFSEYLQQVFLSQ
jgi:hypothetical protein